MREERHSSDIVKTIPIDIENTYMGGEMNCLLETISGIDSVQPYSDVSFRILSKIADVLTNNSSCPVFLISKISNEPKDEMF